MSAPLTGSTRTSADESPPRSARRLSAIRPATSSASSDSGDQPSDSREDLGFPLPASRLGVEPRVVERDRGLVDERLGEPDLVRSEDSTRAPERREGSEGAVAGDERERQDRAMLEALERRVGLGREGDPRIGQHVGGRDRAPSRTARPTAAVPRGSVLFQSTPTPALASSTKSPVSRLIRYSVAMAEPRSGPMLSTMRCPTSSGSREREMSRPTSARISASRRRLSISRRRVRVPDRDGGVIGQAAERRLVPIAERARGAVEDVEQALSSPSWMGMTICATTPVASTWRV